MPLFSRRAAAQELQEGLQVALRGCHSFQTSPNVESRQGVINLRLNQQGLRVGNLHDRGQASLIARFGLPLAISRRLEFDRSVLGHSSRSVERSPRLLHLVGQILKRLVVARFLCPPVGCFDLLLGTDGEKVKGREATVTLAA